MRQTVEWRTDRPPKDGYYLITWIDPRKGRTARRGSVSEAYHSSKAIVRWWWSRRYTGAPSQGIEMAVRHEVIAWMEMPKPFEEGIDDLPKTDRDLAAEFGDLIAEMAIRTEKTEQQVMYELARNYWDIVPFDGEP